MGGREFLSRLEWWFALAAFIGLLLLFSAQALLLTEWGRNFLGAIDKLEGLKVR